MRPFSFSESRPFRNFMMPKHRVFMKGLDIEEALRLEKSLRELLAMYGRLKRYKLRSSQNVDLAIVRKEIRRQINAVRNHWNRVLFL